MDLAHMKQLLEADEIEVVINELKGFVDGYYTRLASDVSLLSNRFEQVSKEKEKKDISWEDYTLEINSMREEALRIINTIGNFGLINYKKKDNEEEIKDQIAGFHERFEKSRKQANKIKSNAVRLREKNSLARELGDIFMSSPELIEDYYRTKSHGIITGIANGYKRAPDVSALDFFESIELSSLGNFTKSCIVNALTELIYSGQVYHGDEKRVDDILDELYPKSHHTVKQNIMRVNSELDYFLGKIKAPEGL